MFLLFRAVVGVLFCRSGLFLGSYSVFALYHVGLYLKAGVCSISLVPLVNNSPKTSQYYCDSSDLGKKTDI